MRFLMLVCVDTVPVPPSTGGMDVDEWVAKTESDGVRLLGDRIQGESSATTVRVREEELLVTDGPFLETKEVLAGFDVLECRDREHAIEIAAAHPMARDGVIELRPFWDWDAEN
jgi:hypothetical protein